MGVSSFAGSGLHLHCRLWHGLSDHAHGSLFVQVPPTDLGRAGLALKLGIFLRALICGKTYPTEDAQVSSRLSLEFLVILVIVASDGLSARTQCASSPGSGGSRLSGRGCIISLLSAVPGSDWRFMASHKIVIPHIIGRITPLISTHEPPSRLDNPR